MNDPYQMNGYNNRESYIKSLCEDYPEEAVYALSQVLGESEDFDGLVSTLQDYFD
jgi:hypothetical protein